MAIVKEWHPNGRLVANEWLIATVKAIEWLISRYGQQLVAH